MLKNLVSGNAYLSVNKKLIAIIGITNSIYLSYIIDECYKSNCEDNKVLIDRSQVENLLTLTTDIQRECELKLNNTNIIEYNDDGSNLVEITVNFSAITGLICSEDPTVINKAKKSSVIGGKVTKAASERQKYKDSLKYSIKAPNNELLVAYQDWVDGVYANPKGFLSRKAILTFQKEIDDFAAGNLDLALKLIEIAAVRGYKEAQWAINVFKAEHASKFYSKYTTPAPAAPSRANLSGEVF